MLRNCFKVLGWNKRFRANLFDGLYGPPKLRDKKQAFFATDNLLIAFSGGMNSVALVHTLHEYIAEKLTEKNRALPFNITVIHIDESLVLSLDSETKTKKNQLLSDYLSKKYNWTLKFYPLELSMMPIQQFLSHTTISNEGLCPSCPFE